MTRTRLTYSGTRPACERDRFILETLVFARDLALDTSSVGEIVIARTASEGIADIRARFGLPPSEPSDSDGCVLRDPRSTVPDFAVILPVRTLRIARNKHDQYKAARYTHKVLHEVAHCHDLALAFDSTLGADLANATAGSSPEALTKEGLRLGIVLNLRAEFEACRLTAGFDSWQVDEDANDMFLEISKLSRGMIDPLDFETHVREPQIGLTMSTRRLGYWWACLAGSREGGRPERHRDAVNAMHRHGLERSCTRFASALRFLHERGYRSWKTMSVFDEAIDAFQEMERDVARLLYT